ncbi:MAG: hypothetical protein WC109_00035 [Syntrophomonadaceae bacterium]|nr:hypothetical protein [Syntrophomonadaceae bacterium]MDD3899068.1 hypothetical protein [Syntrophomonadaceae bacterium]MDD4563105.1 hypothetical protein [Syntrophomonadaceae bacterium]
MKRKKPYFPRPVLKNLVAEIKKMVTSNEGRLSILDLIEDIPFDVRSQVIDSLSAFHDQELVPFYYLLKMEYGIELSAVCDRALEKCGMAGMNITPPVFFKGEFIKSYASISRHTGHMTIDVAWHTGGSRVYVECFYLTFNPDGIHSFFIIDNMPLQQYEKDRKTLPEMIELNMEETCYLLQESYNLNVANMSRPALGKFLYQKYLDREVNQQDYEWIKNLLRRISVRLTPRQVINSFFNALGRNDFAYIFSLLSGRQLSPSLFFERFAELINPDAIILEGEAREVQGTRNTARVTASMIRVENHKFYNSEYRFYLLYESGCWSIGDIEKCSCQLIDPDSEQSPLSAPAFCRVYEIIDIEGLFEILDRVDNIREIEELPCGTHLRISYFDDNFNHGVSFLSGVIADVILNGDELVVISPNRATISDIHHLLNDEETMAAILRGDYEVSLMTAYTYLGGQYINFEDLLFQEEDNSIYDDGMRLITTRYLIKDRERVLKRIEELKTIKIKLDNSYTLYYQIVKESGSSNFFAEYLLGTSWVNVSAFGERDISLARQEFEEQMYGCLEFDGMEVRNEGFFDIITTDVKREYPGLEPELKEIYLDKWYHSQLGPLSGMSPSEACQTEEGSRLLWAMFKNLKQNSKAPYMQYRKNIGLKEYIRKVEQKKESKH